MNSKTIFALFCLFAVSLALAGNTNINCQQGGACNDAGCGKSGAATDNWLQVGNLCVIKDCSSLTATGATVSDNACASCNTGLNPANVIANANKTACQAKSSAKLLIASAAVIVALLF
ncbi:cell surface immobilization antigen SerH6, putative (macronuclear) [Tetrahymena thermophila SB210]|uniref:Cell surface immobilization antigen SerH6, putative n=1 Tax=Tetrahymena thermophila (strain SB210) TaxID=312017 RepID=Q23J62_TETTS|nr:cell surface immobilization antigen SerH6, putative [Tetrahymena thermophila SB210]EAR96642.1 cell surface immobilization antigen SerH6, putative [Tetrahymena thermophila SB210]|eukprot:XP_001016887.1 cell surface immobilization antigen SerH6, putative [Tetrahymena thermophila SB210]